jgi:hypothetical protein
MSSASSANPLAAYLAGQLTAEQLVAAVTADYYGARDSGLGTRLKPLMEIIERAHPGVVELSGNGEKPGYAVRLAERPFPKRHEAELREAVRKAVQNDVGAQHAAPLPDRSTPVPRSTGILTRIIRAIRNIFTA